MRELKIKEGFGSIMVLVPHQDDEILMAAGVLYQAVQAGLPVTVVMVTNGDCDCRDYTKGRTRLRETILGCQRLGVQEEQLCGASVWGTGAFQGIFFPLFLRNLQSGGKTRISYGNHRGTRPLYQGNVKKRPETGD